MVEISTRGIRLLLWIFFSLNNKPSLNALTQKDSSRGTIFRCMGVFHESLSGTYLLGIIGLFLLAIINDYSLKIANTKTCFESKILLFLGLI